MLVGAFCFMYRRGKHRGLVEAESGNAGGKGEREKAEFVSHNLQPYPSITFNAEVEGVGAGVVTYLDEERTGTALRP
jgi:hypothetical protein